MPRLPRLVVANVPLHITQRGVDRCPTFLTAEDFAFYRWMIGEAALVAACAVHAYVLMTNHVHLLITAADVGGPARMMRSLGGRYVRYFNDRYARTGTLWEGRYRSTVVDSAPYLFACSRYIELNPVRAGLVTAAEAYEWSSFRRNACGSDDGVVSERAEFTSLGGDRDTRCAAYRAMFTSDLEPAVIAALRAAQCARPQLHPTSYRVAVDALFDRSDAAAHGSDAGAGRWRQARSTEPWRHRTPTTIGAEQRTPR
jgi:putative transposase